MAQDQTTAQMMTTTTLTHRFEQCHTTTAAIEP